MVNTPFFKQWLPILAPMGRLTAEVFTHTLIERQLRSAMRRHSLPALPLYPEARPCRYPTLFDLVRVFHGAERYEVKEGDRVILFPAPLNALQRQLLELLEVPVSLYQ